MSSGPNSEARTYSPLIRLAGRAHPVLAHALLGEMRSAAVEPNGHSYLAVFDVYKAARDVEGAKRAWQDMRTAGVQPVYPAVSTIMSTVAKTGDISAAEALLQEARDLGLNATTVSYNCILDACHIAGDADAAFRILAEMRAAGFVPDVISYNCALGSLATAGRPAADRARLLEEMRRDGVSQNSLFLERHVCYALGMQLDQSKVSGAEELRAQFQELPAQARREALEAIRDSTESTKLVRALRSILESLEESQDESVQSNQQAQKTESGDWVKVLAKDEAGSQIEYFWDRISGKTQWQHPGKGSPVPTSGGGKPQLCLFVSLGPGSRRSEAFARLKAAQIEELADALAVTGGQRSEACLQYQIDSGVAASMASVITCSVMIARQESRPAAHLWQVDWQVLAKELQPSEDFATKLRVAALQLARGSKLEESLATSLWREMNRLPHIWSSPLPRVTGLGRDSCSLSGLEQLRQCVKEYAQLAAPRKTGTSGDHGGAVCAGSLLMDAGDGRPDAQEDEGEPGRPVSPSLKQETCFVFDWDDTILPTSWLERIHALAGGPLRPEVQRQLASLCSAVTQTLQIASTLGNIVIITNSAPGWVDQSCQIFMPQILQQDRNPRPDTGCLSNVRKLIRPCAMEFFARSVQPPPQRHVPVDVNHGGNVNLDKAAMDQLASAASRILASKKIQEALKPPPAPRPRERLPCAKSSNEDIAERCPDSDSESICSLSSGSSLTDDTCGFPTVLSNDFGREDPKDKVQTRFAPISLPNEQSDMPCFGPSCTSLLASVKPPTFSAACNPLHAGTVRGSMLHPPVVQSEKRHTVAVQTAPDPSSDQKGAPVVGGKRIRSYPIYAKPMHAPLTFKITTFRRECKKFSNLISIGDGDAERAASLRLQAPSERRGPLGEESRQRVKSVKLVELPTCQQLIVQHEMLQVRLPDVTAFHGSLDLKSRFPTGSPQSKLMESDVAEEATASCEIQVHNDDEDCQEHCLPTWWDRHCQLQHTYGSSTLSVRVKALGLRASDVQSLLLGMSSFCARCVDPTVELVLELDASENDLSDEAGAILVSGLQDFGKRRQGHVRLRVLKLHKNQVGDATCQKIASLVWHQKQAVEDVPGLAMPADHGRTWQLRRQQQPGQATMQQGQEEQHQDGGGEAAAPATVTVGPDEADPPNEPWLEHYHSCAKERDAGEDEHRGMVRVGWLGPVERRSRASHYTQPCSLGFLVGYKNDRAESGPRKSVQLRASTAKNETEVGNSSLAGMAWVYAEELDVDIQASPGIDYYIRWVQTSGRALQERAPTARAKREWCCDSTRTDARPGWRSKWPKHSVHMTEEGHFDEGESEDDLAERDESDDELVEEGIAEAAHTAYMFQAAKAKYWEAVKGVCETETTGDGGSLRMETGMTGHPVLSVSQYAAELIHELEDNDVPVELRQQNAPPREEGQGPATHQETEDDGNAGVLQDPAPRPLQLNRRARPTRHSELLPGDGLNFTGAKAISFKGAPKRVLADLDSAFKDQFLETPAGAALPGSTAWLKDMAPSNAVWDKLVLERHIIASEVGEAAAAVSDAKNHSSATATAEATNVRQEPNYPHGPGSKQSFEPGDLVYVYRLRRPGQRDASDKLVLEEDLMDCDDEQDDLVGGEPAGGRLDRGGWRGEGWVEEEDGHRVHGVIITHVDDLLLLAADFVTVSQSEYARARVEKLKISVDMRAGDQAPPVSVKETAQLLAQRRGYSQADEARLPVHGLFLVMFIARELPRRPVTNSADFPCTGSLQASSWQTVSVPVVLKCLLLVKGPQAVSFCTLGNIFKP
ncbi:Pentatricopeptide repeat-containing protein, chloroplastic [Symbiodinium microadriaticum]|uniref:Pentatricopeptide repeat-containing protein, chloroplastic n=1 Tax=Symbiodinium microadriaticum TaxID=2951 RepID=A0A1Q9C7S1_SYMMI|nr:Pentatricopeptide repeat-containing protein, chloroplastic [Symbiodinium microadriaticum]